MPRKGLMSAWALIASIVAACTVTTGTPGKCSADSAVVGCTGTSVGYSCSGTEAPDSTNASLNCSVGVPGKPGVTLYCCETLPAAGTCGPGSTAANCPAASMSVDASPGVDAGPTTCTASSAPGCPANLTEYSCTGTGSPAQSNASLTCGPGITGSGGVSLYCCASSAAAVGNASSEAGVPESSPGNDAGASSAPDAGSCSVGATTGSATCDQCLTAQCCTALVACDTPDDAGVSDAGASACEQLLSCVLDCIAGNADAGIPPASASECQGLCGPTYTSSEQQNASSVLACQSSSCSTSCQ